MPDTPLPSVPRRSEDYKRGYSKGYSASWKWPDHIPPRPPDSVIAGLMDAATRLRNEADDLCAMFGPDDDVTKQLGFAIDALDEAMRLVGVFVKESLEGIK